MHLHQRPPSNAPHEFKLVARRQPLWHILQQRRPDLEHRGPGRVLLRLHRGGSGLVHGPGEHGHTRKEQRGDGHSAGALRADTDLEAAAFVDGRFAECRGL